MTGSITFFTPSYALDFARFCLQRESLERCGIDLPHVVVVNDEDVPLFRATPHRANLTILSTRDVLPPSFERRRKVWRISRKDYRYWITGPGICGWSLQQLLKLASPDVIGAKAIVCLDSDTFFVDRVTADDFYADDGRLHLYETTDDVDVQMAEWQAHSLRFLGQGDLGVPVRRYTHSPVPLHRDLVLALRQQIEKLHGMFWMDAILQADRIMEYTTYGVFARHVDNLRHACPTTPSLALYYWWAKQAENLQANFNRQLAESNAKMVLINSNVGLPVESYRELVSAAWNNMAPIS